MADMMTFPETVEEFMDQYKITDTEQVYTNGTELVPIFRMKQWFEHLSSVQPEKRTDKRTETHACDCVSRQAAIDAIDKHIDAFDAIDTNYLCGLRTAMSFLKEMPSVQPETFEWCHDCKEYDQEKHCCHRWTKQIRKTVEELEANYPKEAKDELLYWKERAAQMERDYIRITGIRKHVPNIDLEEVEDGKTE